MNVFLIHCLVYQMWRKCERNAIHNIAHNEVFHELLLSDQQSYTQGCSNHRHTWQRQAANPLIWLAECFAVCQGTPWSNESNRSSPLNIRNIFELKYDILKSLVCPTNALEPEIFLLCSNKWQRKNSSSSQLRGLFIQFLLSIYLIWNKKWH